jgi:hypothetical protein
VTVIERLGVQHGTQFHLTRGAGSHHCQALVLDSPVVQYFASQAEECDLLPVGECDNHSEVCVEHSTQFHLTRGVGSHHCQALVLDSPVVQYFASQAEECDLFPVGKIAW